MKEQYANKTTRDRLGNKSVICFGSRGKWLKLMRSLGLNIDLVEKQMDEIIKMKQDIIKMREEKSNELRQKND